MDKDGKSDATSGGYVVDKYKDKDKDKNKDKDGKSNATSGGFIAIFGFSLHFHSLSLSSFYKLKYEGAPSLKPPRAEQAEVCLYGRHSQSHLPSQGFFK